MTRREIRLAEGDSALDPFKATACLSHTCMVPCPICTETTESHVAIWSQRPAEVQHVRNEVAWRQVK